MRILIDEKGKKYRADPEDLHTNWGYIKKEEIESGQEGQTLKTHLGREFKVIKPNINDYIDLIQRRCSIILPKDLGIITAYVGLGSGKRVVEAGSGSGAAALYFGNVVGSTGQVTSYEIREDFANIAQENIDGFGLVNVEIKCQDIKEGIDEEEVDLIFLDLPRPWDVVEAAAKSLKVGGYLAAYNPFMEQMLTLHKVMKKRDFSNLITVECILREIEVKNKGARPKTRMVGHTGYLTFGRLL